MVGYKSLMRIEGVEMKLCAGSGRGFLEGLSFILAGSTVTLIMTDSGSVWFLARLHFDPDSVMAAAADSMLRLSAEISIPLPPLTPPCCGTD